MLNQSAENHLYNYKYPLEKYTLLQNYLTEPTLSDDKKSHYLSPMDKQLEFSLSDFRNQQSLHQNDKCQKLHYLLLLY